LLVGFVLVLVVGFRDGFRVVSRVGMLEGNTVDGMALEGRNVGVAKGRLVGILVGEVEVKAANRFSDREN
jgi:hypothetical protein